MVFWGTADDPAADEAADAPPVPAAALAPGIASGPASEVLGQVPLQLSRGWPADSRARSSQANTHTVAMPSKPIRAGAAKNSSQLTSPWPTSRCWCTRAVEPGG